VLPAGKKKKKKKKKTEEKKKKKKYRVYIRVTAATTKQGGY
jgi:hypothetical protein